MKYCYRCGLPYRDDEDSCPQCGITLHTTEPNTQTRRNMPDVLVPDWSNRCVSCRFCDSNNKCDREDSPNYKELILNPKQTNCNCWRYKF
jgi:hypothetical protein